jgi:hypothetical protein
VPSQGEVVIKESMVLPSWNGSRLDRLLGLMAQKGGLSRVAWRTPCPSDTPSYPTKLNNIERWAQPGSLEDSCPSNARARPT